MEPSSWLLVGLGGLFGIGLDLTNFRAFVCLFVGSQFRTDHIFGADLDERVLIHNFFS